ncbi:hypothetical protein N9N67_07480 [Bacteriovoracaceae bacterium]|nr:hypothetical protein [Bacteriovoracaceae bacterium]
MQTSFAKGINCSFKTTSPETHEKNVVINHLLCEDEHVLGNKNKVELKGIHEFYNFNVKYNYELTYDFINGKHRVFLKHLLDVVEDEVIIFHSTFNNNQIFNFSYIIGVESTSFEISCKKNKDRILCVN